MARYRYNVIENEMELVDDDDEVDVKPKAEDDITEEYGVEYLEDREELTEERILEMLENRQFKELKEV